MTHFIEHNPFLGQFATLTNNGTIEEDSKIN